MAKLFVVGDSTVAKFNDVSYYYPRYGYGALLDKYFNIEVLNYALSGRSSKSYMKDKEYEKVFNEMTKGDYLIIGFGHNDQKSDDVVRFASAKLGTEVLGSFKNVVYNYYIKRALQKGVTPILCTPVVRLDLTKKYEGNAIHDLDVGNYKQAILDLAKETNILGIDLTTSTKDYMLTLSEKDALIEHAMTNAIIKDGVLVANPKSVDKTHLSYLGAYNVAYMIALAVSKSNVGLKDYLVDNIIKPTKEVLNVNPSYVYKEYKSPDLDSYTPSKNFKANDYYGSAFGNIDVLPNEESGFVAKALDDKYIVGCYKEYGKFNASNDGFAYLFKRIDKKLNFEIEANLKVIFTSMTKQAGFGLMLRNDAYINQEKPNESYQTNYIAPGLLTTDGQTYATFSRAVTTELDKEYPLIEGYYQNNTEIKVYLKRLGQVIDTTVIYDNKEYKKSFIDFDILSVDPKYLFLGFFATKGTVIEVSDIVYKEIGKAIEA